MKQTTLLIEELNKVLGFILDKIKIKYPLLYVILQLTFVILIVLFSNNTININDEMDMAIVAILSALTFTAPRTTQYKQKYEESNKIEKVQFKQNYKMDLQRIKDQGEKLETAIQESQPVADEIDMDGEGGIVLPFIDQSNN